MTENAEKKLLIYLHHKFHILNHCLTKINIMVIEFLRYFAFHPNTSCKYIDKIRLFYEFLFFIRERTKFSIFMISLAVSSWRILRVFMMITSHNFLSRENYGSLLEYIFIPSTLMGKISRSLSLPNFLFLRKQCGIFEWHSFTAGGWNASW